MKRPEKQKLDNLVLGIEKLVFITSRLSQDDIVKDFLEGSEYFSNYKDMLFIYDCYYDRKNRAISNPSCIELTEELIRDCILGSSELLKITNELLINRCIDTFISLCLKKK